MTLSRRRLLVGGATVGVTVGVTGGATLAVGGDAPGPVAHLGAHQPGIANPAPAHAIVAAFDTTAADIDELRDLLAGLGRETDLLSSGVLGPAKDPLLPPNDNGILGPRPEPGDLTVTVALGASLFDQRFGLAELRPAELFQMPDFPNDEPHPERSHGDILIQLCATHEDVAIHALRRLMRSTRRHLTLRWMQAGFNQPSTLPHGQTSTRNLLGFKDGTVNPDVADAADMDATVWAGAGEPPWAAGGTYMVVRLIRNRVEFWDRTALATQEAIIGRTRDTGAPLDGTLETDEPNFAADPDGAITPLTAHIRLANPRTAATSHQRILRRGFGYSNGFTTDGQLDQGLLFVAFQRSLGQGFLAIQERLNGEALEEYIRPVGGGFYFVPPGRSAVGEPFAAGLVGLR